jgi:DNA-binding winged helix-turn-helix (wHTH) protein/TolB-like protein/Tfp pilus assembly protein PilF
MDRSSRFLEFGDFVVDVRQRRLLRRTRGEAIPLTAKVFDTLLYFVQRPGEVLDKDALMSAVWPGVVVEENSLTQNVSTLRQVLGEARGDHRYIVTVPRRGYQFVAEVISRDTFSGQAVAAPTAEPISVALAEVATASIDSAAAGHDATTAAIGAPGGPTAPRGRALHFAIVVVSVAVLAAAAVVVLTMRSRDSAEPPARVLAVLPFKPVVPARRDESLELGMTESLIRNLSELDGVVIQPLSSVRRFGTPDQDPLAAGRALGVQAVLDGSLQHDGRRLRVSARLLDVSDGRQLWGGSFDENLTTIFDVQDAIAHRVSDALRAPLTNGRAGKRPRRDTEDSQAYLLYANGRLSWSRFTEQGLVQAIDYFEKAIARDPHYALAHAGLADCYVILGVFGMRPPHEVFPRARQAVEQALEIQPDLAAAHTTLGHIKIQYDLDWSGGLNEYARAIELDPNYAPTYHYRGIVLAMHGLTDRSLADLQRAQQLEPLWMAPRAATGNTLVYARRYDEAIAYLNRVLELDERADNARTYLGRAYLHSGRYDQALQEFAKRRALAPGSYGDVAQALALSGRRQEALEELARLRALSATRHVQALDFATVYASLGENEKVFPWLERAYEDRSTNIGFLAQDPTFDALHGDPRFIALVERIGVWKRPL